MIELPQPENEGQMSVEAAIKERTSIRNFLNIPLTIHHVSQLLWAAQGATKSGSRRTVPSAGALYPLEVYAVIGNVENFSPGIFYYRQQQHGIEPMRKGDFRNELTHAALNQGTISRGALSLVFSATHGRMTSRYGSRAERYINMEAGHAGQNVYLQATALGLGTVAIGAFEDDKVHKLLDMKDGETPLYIMPVGKV